MQDQAALIVKLTARIEANEEAFDITKETLRKTEHQLKTETDRFHVKLSETQKYFEEMLAELEGEGKRLKEMIHKKDKEIAQRENDLREIIQRHEQDIQRIMSKEEGNIQDEIIRMFEQKLKDNNEVLEGKLKVIEVLQKESGEREKELQENKETIKVLREKLQVGNLHRLFSFAHLTQWQSLFCQVHHSKSAPVFKTALKTHLFNSVHF